MSLKLQIKKTNKYHQSNKYAMKRLKITHKVFLSLMMLVTSINYSQTEKFGSLYDLGENLVKVAKSGNPDKIVDLIEPEIDIDKKAEILESFLQIKESMFNITDVSKMGLFNVIKQGEYTYLIMKNDKKFFVLKSKTNENNKLIDHLALINTQVTDALLKGSKIYKMRCYSCHGKDGKGMIAPNLTDNYWKYVNSEEELENVIKNGKKGTMMIPYKDYLTPEELKAVILYTKALQGKKVENAKKPEGEKKDISFHLVTQ